MSASRSPSRIPGALGVRGPNSQVAKSPQLLASSSCAIYGEPATVPISERTVLNPIIIYGFTKLVCEHMMEPFWLRPQAKIGQAALL